MYHGVSLSIAVGEVQERSGMGGAGVITDSPGSHSLPVSKNLLACKAVSVDDILQYGLLRTTGASCGFVERVFSVYNGQYRRLA